MTTTLVIEANADLTQANSLRLPSTADFVLRASSVADVRRAIEWCKARSQALTILGGGSNVIMHRHVPGCVLIPDLTHVATKSTGAGVDVTVGAGMVWNDLVRYALGRGLRGLENLALIPGRVGGAPVQNIGAYGVELDTVIEAVTVVDTDSLELVELLAADCEFSYRDSSFRREGAQKYVIVEVRLRLRREGATVTSYPDIERELAAMGRSGVRPIDVADAVVRVRRRKLPDPRSTPNAGSFFKNPVVSARELDSIAAAGTSIPAYAISPGRFKLAAAALIDACGFKQRPTARAAVWPRQALVLINRGGADATDMLALADAIRDEVGDRFGVSLELEPRQIGKP